MVASFKERPVPIYIQVPDGPSTHPPVQARVLEHRTLAEMNMIDPSEFPVSGYISTNIDRHPFLLNKSAMFYCTYFMEIQSNMIHFMVNITGTRLQMYCCNYPGSIRSAMVVYGLRDVQERTSE